MSTVGGEVMYVKFDIKNRLCVKVDHIEASIH